MGGEGGIEDRLEIGRVDPPIVWQAQFSAPAGQRMGGEIDGHGMAFLHGCVAPDLGVAERRRNGLTATGGLI